MGNYLTVELLGSLGEPNLHGGINEPDRKNAAADKGSEVLQVLLSFWFICSVWKVRSRMRRLDLETIDLRDLLYLSPRLTSIRSLNYSENLSRACDSGFRDISSFRSLFGS